MAPSSTSPAQLNKAGRAKLAKDTINNVIPHILTTNKRAQDGVDSSELIHYSSSLDPPKRISADSAASAEDSELDVPKVKVSVIKSDTFDAVHAITTTQPGTKVAALNMASALRKFLANYLNSRNILLRSASQLPIL
jgi:hypothetical protein